MLCDKLKFLTKRSFFRLNPASLVKNFNWSHRLWARSGDARCYMLQVCEGKKTLNVLIT